MMNPKNECIDSIAFAALILDYEFAEDKSLGWPAYVSCRVLIDGWKRGDIVAGSRHEAIEKFRHGEY